MVSCLVFFGQFLAFLSRPFLSLSRRINLQNRNLIWQLANFWHHMRIKSQAATAFSSLDGS